MVMPTELQYHVNSNMSHSYKKDFFFFILGGGKEAHGTGESYNSCT